MSTGQLTGILRKHKLRAEPEILTTAKVTADAGVEGDYRGRMMPDERQITVLFADGWQEAVSELGVSEIPWHKRRANLLVENLENPKKAGGFLRIGKHLMIEVTDECHPCSRMEDVMPGLKAAMLPNWRGGIMGHCLNDGTIELGDTVLYEELPEAADIVGFWLEEIGGDGWYKSSPEQDAEIERRFGGAVVLARLHRLDAWQENAKGALALLLLLDQFSRNIYRGDAQSFAGDNKALKIAKKAISRGFDQQIAVPERQFFYMPFEHSEDEKDQDYAIELFKSNPEFAPALLQHAKTHRMIIRTFGRFPYRNQALGRKSTKAETAFMNDGGYMNFFENIQAKG